MIIEPVIGAVYRGRFAPSPTGPLHFGSLVSALGSYLDAKVHGGEWLVRIEDVDKLRCRPEHEAAILRTLERYGFRWDGAIMRQSERTEAYREELKKAAFSNAERAEWQENCNLRKLLRNAIDFEE